MCHGSSSLPICRSSTHTQERRARYAPVPWWTVAPHFRCCGLSRARGYHLADVYYGHGRHGHVYVGVLVEQQESGELHSLRLCLSTRCPEFSSQDTPGEQANQHSGEESGGQTPVSRWWMVDGTVVLADNRHVFPRPLHGWLSLNGHRGF